MRIIYSLSQIEHPSVMEVFKYLEKNYSDRLNVHYLPVTKEGIIDLSIFKSLISPLTAFISIMHANNETGVLQPITEMFEISKNINKDIIFHTDAAQSIGKVEVNVQKLGIHLLSVCSHKFYGPKGIGALYIKKGYEEKLEKIIHGANHERNLRAGTENVLEIVGLGVASELAAIELEERIIHFKKTRNLIYKKLISQLDNVVLHGPAINLHDENQNELRLSNTLFISFPGLEANLILDLVSEKIACSAGAACHSDEVKMSHVLEAMKVPKNIAMGTIRISTGLKLTIDEANDAADFLIQIVKKLSKSNNDDQKNLFGDDDEVCKLTRTTHGLGCGCKISPKVLNTLLQSLPSQKSVMNNKNIMVGNETGDDCCVYKLDEKTAIIKTLDFLTPICDNAKDYGAIACANAISDIYAMGGNPILALNIVCFPIKILPTHILTEIMLGAQEKAEEANVPILGGHSIEDNEPKFGMSVTGLGHPNFIWKNSTAKDGDFILLTKKIGVGVMMTALKKQLINYEDDNCQEVINSMKRLNKYHCEILRKMEDEKDNIVNACTDVTGFGVLGHLKECLEGSKLSAIINYESIEFFNNAKEFIEMDIIPGGTLNNYNFTKDICIFDQTLSYSEKLLINDAQTSGGLLIFIPKKYIDNVIKIFNDNKLYVRLIGQCFSNKKENTIIEIKKK